MVTFKSIFRLFYSIQAISISYLLAEKISCIVGIFIFISRENFMLSWVEHKNLKFYNFGVRYACVTSQWKLATLYTSNCSDTLNLLICFNPFLPSGFFYYNSLDLSISNIRGVWLDFINTMFYRNLCIYANSVDPDQTPRSAASELGLRCLQMTLLWDARLYWVKLNMPSRVILALQSQCCGSTSVTFDRLHYATTSFNSSRIPRIGCIACLKRQSFDMKKGKKHWSLKSLLSLKATRHYKLRLKSMHPFKSYWGETISLPRILPQQQKLSLKRAITWPKFCGWLPISNLTCILQ